MPDVIATGDPVLPDPGIPDETALTPAPPRSV